MCPVRSVTYVSGRSKAIDAESIFAIFPALLLSVDVVAFETAVA
jgi:hypothetical protein